MTDLTGKVAVVLGASAEAGTGWGVAEGLAAAGARVVVGARSFEPLQKLAAKIGGLAVRCDAGNEQDIITLRDAALKAYGKIDIAVNSAATPVLGLIADANQAALELGINVNYYGMVYFVKYMAETMHDGGSIVLISSLSATRPVFPHFAYACGKAATECLVRYAALEYGARQIRINSIAIGTVVSDMAGPFFNTPGVGERFAKEVPLGRLGVAADIANAVLWLAGPSYITGSCLDINGGNHINRFPFVNELPGETAGYEGTGALYDREHGLKAEGGRTVGV